jgi:hypothetical protein
MAVQEHGAAGGSGVVPETGRIAQDLGPELSRDSGPDLDPGIERDRTPARWGPVRSVT